MNHANVESRRIEKRASLASLLKKNIVIYSIYLSFLLIKILLYLNILANFVIFKNNSINILLYLFYFLHLSRLPCGIYHLCNRIIYIKTRKFMFNMHGWGKFYLKKKRKESGTNFILKKWTESGANITKKKSDKPFRVISGPSPH